MADPWQTHYLQSSIRIWQYVLSVKTKPGVSDMNILRYYAKSNGDTWTNWDLWRALGPQYWGHQHSLPFGVNSIGSMSKIQCHACHAVQGYSKTIMPLRQWYLQYKTIMSYVWSEDIILCWQYDCWRWGEGYKLVPKNWVIPIWISSGNDLSSWNSSWQCFKQQSLDMIQVKRLLRILIYSCSHIWLFITELVHQLNKSHPQNSM